MMGPAGQVHAYLDPGTGNLLIQTILGLLLAVAVLGRKYWLKCKRFFDKLMKRKSKSSN